MKPLRTPALTPATLVKNPANTRLALLARQGCALRDPRNWSPTCDSNAEAAASETARYPEIPVSWGLKPGAIVRFRSGTSAFTARDAIHYTTIAIVVGQGGWTRSSGLRLPTPALFQLSYTLYVALQPSHATPDRCFADWPRLRNRDVPSVAISSREERLAPRSGFEPLSNVLTARCLAASAIAE